MQIRLKIIPLWVNRRPHGGPFHETAGKRSFQNTAGFRRRQYRATGIRSRGRRAGGQDRAAQEASSGARRRRLGGAAESRRGEEKARPEEKTRAGIAGRVVVGLVEQPACGRS